MPPIETRSDPDGPLTREFIENCSGSLQWAVWARGLAVELLSGPQADTVRRLRTDSGLSDRAREVHKMLVVDRAGAQLREHILKHLIERLADALKRSGRMPAGEPHDLAIDFSILPTPDDINGEDIASLRPVVGSLRA